MPLPNYDRSMSSPAQSVSEGCSPKMCTGEVNDVGRVTFERWGVVSSHRDGKCRYVSSRRDVKRLRTRHTLRPLARHWSHWPGRLVNRGEGRLFSKRSSPVNGECHRPGMTRNVAEFDARRSRGSRRGGRNQIVVSQPLICTAGRQIPARSSKNRRD